MVKPHGIRGEVVVVLVTDRVERLAPGTVLATAGRSLEVRSSRPHQGAHLVAFAGVSTRDEAEGLRGAVLRAAPIEDADALWVHDLIGREVVEVGGTVRGRVTAVEANPASDLLVLDGGALVPLTFLVGREEGRLVVDVPDGLFD